MTREKFVITSHCHEFDQQEFDTLEAAQEYARVINPKFGYGIRSQIRVNHRYQLTLRPFSFCSVPKGFIPGSAKDLQIRAGNYGSIAYPDKLASDVVEHFDLKYLGEEPEGK